MTARLLGNWPDRSPEWLAARKGRIGGSDLGALLGWSQYKTPADLAAEKLGKLPLDAAPPSVAQERGIYCEDAIRRWVGDRCQFTWDPAMVGTWVDADDDRLLVNPDGVSTDGYLLEAKTCAVRDAEHGWGRAGTDRIPLSYSAQTVWGMGILGLEHAVVGVLSGAPTFGFSLYRVDFDQETFDYLRARAVAFLDSLNERTAA